MGQRNDRTVSAIIGSLERGERLGSTDGTDGRFLQIWEQLGLSNEGCLFRRFCLRDISVSVPVTLCLLCIYKTAIGQHTSVSRELMIFKVLMHIGQEWRLMLKNLLQRASDVNCVSLLF